MKTSKISIILLSILASPGLISCAKKKTTSAAAASSTSTATSAVEDRSAQVLGFWKAGECIQLTDTANKDLYQSDVLEINATLATVQTITFLDSKCTQPVISAPPVISYPLQLTGPFTSNADLIGLKITNPMDNSINYSSVLIDGSTLRFADNASDGTDEAHRAVATSSSTPFAKVTVPSDFLNNDSITLNKSYLSECLQTSSAPNPKSVNFVLSFVQADKKITVVLKEFTSLDCSGASTSTDYPSLAYDSLFLKSTTYGSHTETQGYAPLSDGSATVHIRIFNGKLTIDGTVPGQPKEASTLTEI